MDADETSHLTHLPSNWLRGLGARKCGLWINRCRESAQKDCDHIIPPLSPYNQHHHHHRGRIRVDIQWNCDRIIFLSERGRNNWTHRPPSDSSISWPPADYMISENTRKMSNPFVSFLRPTPLCGGLCDAGQIGRVDYCQGAQNRHKDQVVGAKTRLLAIWCWCARCPWWVRKQGRSSCCCRTKYQ